MPEFGNDSLSTLTNFQKPRVRDQLVSHSFGSVGNRNLFHGLKAPLFATCAAAVRASGSSRRDVTISLNPDENDARNRAIVLNRRPDRTCR
jgi:hypothetical protein